jgi:prepilin peptidase CpaA
MMPLASVVPLLAAIALLSAAALHDAAFRTIPNQLAAALALCGLALRASSGNLPGAIIAALIVFVAAAFCWRRGWMGGGDVKLLGATALLVPPGHVPMMLASVAIAGGALTLPYLAARRRLPPPALARPTAWHARILRAERWRLRRGGPLPYAVAIAAGAGIAIAQGGAS